MGKEVNLSIILPSRIYLQEKVSSVIIPAVRADIDILPDRAPSVFALDFGLLQILNEKIAFLSFYTILSVLFECFCSFLASQYTKNYFLLDSKYRSKSWLLPKVDI